MSLRESLASRLAAVACFTDGPEGDGMNAGSEVTDAGWLYVADECIRQMEHARKIQSMAYMRADGKVGYWEPRNYEWPPLTLAPAESSDTPMQPRSNDGATHDDASS